MGEMYNAKKTISSDFISLATELPVADSDFALKSSNKLSICVRTGITFLNNAILF